VDLRGRGQMALEGAMLYSVGSEGLSVVDVNVIH
jgi:hypothetical protein